MLHEPRPGAWSVGKAVRSELRQTVRRTEVEEVAGSVVERTQLSVGDEVRQDRGFQVTGTSFIGGGQQRLGQHQHTGTTAPPGEPVGDGRRGYCLTGDKDGAIGGHVPGTLIRNTRLSSQ